MVGTSFDLQSRTARATVTFLTACLYALVYVPLYHHFGATVSLLTTIPVLVAAWLFGLRAGVLAGALAFPLNMLLLKLAGEPEGVYRGEMATLAVVALLAPVVGWLGMVGRLVTRERDPRANRPYEARCRTPNFGFAASLKRHRMAFSCSTPTPDRLRKSTPS